MKLLPTILLFGVLLGVCHAEDEVRPVRWSTAERLADTERSRFFEQALQALRAAGDDLPDGVPVKAEFVPERDLEPFQEVSFTFGRAEDEIRVRCIYPFRKGVMLYCNWGATVRAQKYGDALFDAARRKAPPSVDQPLAISKRHTRQEAEQEAIRLAQTVGQVDLSTWRCMSWNFDRGQWMFSFHPFFKDHRMNVADVNINLSDGESLKLCKYHNTMLAPLPQYEAVPSVISQTAARELADGYVETYYKRQPVEQSETSQMFYRKQTRTAREKTGTYQRVPDLAFVTNVLEVVRPNYYFTDKYDETGKWLKNAPRWSWTARYSKVFSTNFFTFSKTPVWIYVDALTGEMLGGSE